jgi:lipoprotein-releasing system permease protein
MVAVGVPVAAMVILLSVFNGFDDLIRRMYRDFDPDLLVQPAEGKVFDPQTLDTEAVNALDGVAAVSFILEESALLEYRGKQATATIRGVDSLFGAVVPLDNMLYAGVTGGRGAVVGQGIAYNIGIRLGLSERLKFFVPRRGSYSALLPVSAFSAGDVLVDGVFVLDADTDGEYVIVPLDFAQELFDYGGMASGLAIRLAEGAEAKQFKAAVAEIAGDDFNVLDRYEQKASMYRIMKLEKWGIFFIGLMVLVIASFSIVGSLIMLIIDKRTGIRTLRAMGASTHLVRSVFVRQGMAIGTIGAAGGLALGVAVCAVQQIFGVVRLPAASFLVDSYPVLIRPMDMVLVCVAFLTVNFLITIFTVRATITRNETGMF